MKRRLQGCFYFGCFAPLVFAALAVLIGVQRARRGLRTHSQETTKR